MIRRRHSGRGPYWQLWRQAAAQSLWRTMVGARRPSTCRPRAAATLLREAVAAKAPAPSGSLKTDVLSPTWRARVPHLRAALLLLLRRPGKRSAGRRARSLLSRLRRKGRRRTRAAHARRERSSSACPAGTSRFLWGRPCRFGSCTAGGDTSARLCCEPYHSWHRLGTRLWSLPAAPAVSCVHCTRPRAVTGTQARTRGRTGVREEVTLHGRVRLVEWVPPYLGFLMCVRA